ncbi:hypothetical protein FB451DRAFT_301096 [Mycena latifolia]|nr:hypothetical protein FB451DRAFT_301096 [Mycena latifolia]
MCFLSFLRIHFSFLPPVSSAEGDSSACRDHPPPIPESGVRDRLKGLLFLLASFEFIFLLFSSFFSLSVPVVMHYFSRTHRGSPAAASLASGCPTRRAFPSQCHCSPVLFFLLLIRLRSTLLLVGGERYACHYPPAKSGHCLLSRAFSPSFLHKAIVLLSVSSAEVVRHCVEAPRRHRVCLQT